MKQRLNLMSQNRESEMSRKEMKDIRIRMGFGSMCANWSGCACGCRFEGRGGSDTETNFDANREQDKVSPGVTYEEAVHQHIIKGA